MIFDVQSDSGTATGTNQQRISVVDADLRSQKCLANVQQRTNTFGKLHDQEIALGERQTRTLENLNRSFGIAQDHSDNRTVGGIDNGKRDNTDVCSLEVPHYREQIAHAIFDENVELPHTRPVAAACGGIGSDGPASVVVFLTHNTPLGLKKVL